MLIGKQDANGTDRIYLATYQRAGANLVKSSEIVISPVFQRAALPAITVKDDGTRRHRRQVEHDRPVYIVFVVAPHPIGKIAVRTSRVAAFRDQIEPCRGS